MEHDCLKYVRACQQCQIYADKEKVLIPLNNMTTPWPFSMWGIDVIGKMTTKYHDWHEMLPYALLAYRTSIRTSTGATLYALLLKDKLTVTKAAIPDFRKY